MVSNKRARSDSEPPMRRINPFGLEKRPTLSEATKDISNEYTTLLQDAMATAAARGITFDADQSQINYRNAVAPTVLASDWALGLTQTGTAGTALPQVVAPADRVPDRPEDDWNSPPERLHGVRQYDFDVRGELFSVYWALTIH